MNSRLTSFAFEIRQTCSISDVNLNLLLAAFASGLPVLLEDVPGVGKTTLARSLAQTAGLEFSRIQGAPDLLPGDIVGMTIWDQDLRSFRYRPGPLMAHTVLVDELNRAGTRTQAALLEALEEGHVTVDGVSHKLPQPFFLIATQNPSGFAGTYTLPEAQLDRFGLLLKLGYPENETEVIKRSLRSKPEVLAHSYDAQTILDLRKQCETIQIADVLVDYVASVLSASRKSPFITLGLSPRAGIHWLRLSRALALYFGRDFVLPSDLEMCAISCLSHRMIVTPQARMDGISSVQALKQLIAKIPLPNGL